MKTFLSTFIIIILLSCSSKQGIQLEDSSDYEIAQLALGNYTKWDAYRLLEIPDVSTTDDYLEGFTTMELIEFPQKFHYKSFSKEKWKKHLFSPSDVKDKLQIIKNFGEVIKVNNDGKIYVSLSRPIYSEDGKYAVIIVNMLSNNTSWEGEGYGYVYEKISGKWKLHLKFIPYLT
ncbi:hypothetical protein [Flavobacterium sp.]|uniref:hypothetical protein n=1 Tax=Flavobacterium sp. TaxID=239 RepID=UPI00261B4CBD|nr:hypothetical protein [Flavobacterium sp.]